MHVSLTPTLECLIQEKVDSGLYNSASEVIREALRMLFEKEEYLKRRFEELNRDIDMGLADIDAGRVVDGQAFMKKLASKYEK